MGPISGLGQPTSQNDAVTKNYVDDICKATKCSCTMITPHHDPRFAEIEQILSEVGLKFIQVAGYATESYPYGCESQTAQCVNYTQKLLVNINKSKQFAIQVGNIDMFTLPGPATWFDMYSPDFFVRLAQYLRKEKALSLSKYWFVRFKLWWNK